MLLVTNNVLIVMTTVNQGEQPNPNWIRSDISLILGIYSIAIETPNSLYTCGKFNDTMPPQIWS